MPGQEHGDCPRLRWRSVAFRSPLRAEDRTAWRIGGPRGDAMTRRLARLAGALGSAAFTGHAMDYPYYLLWTGAYADFQEHMQGFEPP